jgi:hypothetical protein
MLRPKSLDFAYIIDLHLKYIQSNNSMFIYKAQAANGINNFKFEDLINEENLFGSMPQKGDDLLDEDDVKKGRMHPPKKTLPSSRHK